MTATDRRVRLVALAAAAAAAVSGCSAAPSATRGSTRTSSVEQPGGSLAAYVLTAATRTLAQHTAQATVSGVVAAAGKTVPVTGGGVMDFASGASSLTLREQVGNESVTERELEIGGRLYFGVDAAGRTMKSMTGCDWVAMPVNVGSTQQSPAALISTLRQKGAAVRDLGTATVGGAATHGYAVTLSRQQVIDGARKALAKAALPSGTQQKILDLARSLTPPIIKVWFDGQQLMRRMTLDMSVGTSQSTITFDFTRFGIPAHVTAPSPGDVVSFARFEQIVAGK